jgi:glycine oxidase
MPDQFDAIIAGAGIIGASIAWRLARHNFRVLLLDAATVGAEASSAAAGMLTPGGEFEDPTMRELANRSLAMYRDFVLEIEADSGLSVEFRQTGTVELDAAARPGSRPLTREELRTLAPFARTDTTSAIFFPDDAIVDPAALMQALRAACLARGVCLRERSPVAEIHADSKGANIADVRGAGVRAPFAVLAAGAWSSGIALRVNDQPYKPPRSFPVKGHLLGYRLPPGSLPITVRQEHTYVLQRADGFTIAGSSAENAGFDRAIDPKIVSEIAARAGALVPALQSLEPESVWIGFRPAIDAPAPQIGRVASALGDPSRLWLAYGHYRNGILLAPVTSDRISRELATARR